MKNKYYVWLLSILLMFPVGLAAQNIVVKGNVSDSQGEPIIGASVVEKGNKSNGVITDLDGHFSITVGKGKKIVISYIGMETQEVDAIVGKGLIIVLKDDSQALDEIVVIGYGSRARKDLTGSVGSISGVRLAAVPVTSAAVALQGKIAGVQVTTVDGAPGADINIRVRGGTSVTQSNDPLYIVDGFQTDNINDIPPTDIASIDVLKDASLTAIYGAKGGNGVVVVTTKSAQQGKVQVGFNTQVSVSKLAKKLDLMNTADFVRYQYDWAAANGTRSSNAKYYRANFGNPLDLDIYQRATTHDWQDEVMGETPFNYSTNLTVGGGSEKFRFNTSLTNSEDKGIILGSGVRRTNLNIKMNIQLTNNLTLTINPKFTFRRDTGAGGDKIGGGGIIDVLRYRPTNGLREFAFWDPETVDPDDEAVFEYTNPKNDIGQNTLKKHSYAYTNQFSLDWQPIKGLTLRTEAAYYISFNDENRFYGAMTDEGQDNKKLPVASIKNKHTEKYTWTNTASYGFEIDQLHNFSFLLGQEIQHDRTKESYIKNRYFPRNISSERALNNMGLGTTWESTSSLSTPERTASFFGQASYNYNHKYLVSGTFRADGSTKFAPGEQWGYFPSISGAWVLSKERFLENNPIISNLKLRGAVGLAGNNRIDNDMWRYLYAVNTTGGPGFGEATENGEKWYGEASGKSVFPNTKIKWETTLTRNLAFDLDLFNGRLTVTPEVYWNTTKDLLYKSDVPSTTGYTQQMQNIGQVTNKGFELSINGDILRGKDYVLSGNFTLGFNKMKVDKLNNTDDVIWDQNDRWKSSYNDYCLKVGDQVGLIYGFVYDGLYSFDEFDFDPNQNLLAVPKEGTIINNVLNNSNSGVATLPGKIKFKDISGPDGKPDGQITEDDRSVIGNTNPKFQGGFGLSGQWKGFDFTANFNYMYDFDVNNATAYQLSSSEGNSQNFFNVLSKFNNRWTYVGKDGECMYKNNYLENSVETYKELNAGKTLWNPADVTNKVTHSYFIEDGSFLRCQDITLGYTLPKSLSNKWGMSRLRLYVSGSNLFIITGYSGYDPEVDVQTGLTCGMDYNRYPRSRSFVFGANITF
ncbi:SusC/RagA family TonB-linked outer membrane protein [Bacteroides ihuae]|uniref:SusC/RagA family TonB-linked outer membrane protein n=1 Tax=Bacteroides ihuae TaxID=1852362 RepID=UPI0008DA42C9|nr:TonB-dependent receptor [Bacteroides ihuae]